MSAIAFYFSDIIIGVRNDAFLSSYWSASKKSSLACGSDVEVLPLYVHANSGVLSQKLSMCLNIKYSTTYSFTSHTRSNPANSRSFIFNLPFVFVQDTS